MKILVLGANGLIGRTVLRVLSSDNSLEVFGTLRGFHHLQLEENINKKKIISGVDILDKSKILDVFSIIKPDVVINCVGLTKHKRDGNNPINAIKINTLHPHFLAQVSKIFECRFIHLSTDCVFSGKKGFYSECDLPDANDLYGRSKALGEVSYGDALTIRTSTIGHELDSNLGLLNWFLSQTDKCNGFSKAIFSGLPTVVLARVIRDFVLSNKKLVGLYHVAADPINKYDLLNLIAKQYKKKIEIEIDSSLEINRSLNPEKFNVATGFKCPDWPSLIEEMYLFH